MWFMYGLSWIAMIIQICFVTLAIAAGLFYLAELVEEYTVTSARIIKYMIWATTLALVGLLLFEDMPWALLGSCLASNVAYYFVLQTFPFIQLLSPVFIVSLALLVVNHYLAFSYFATTWHPFSEFSFSALTLSVGQQEGLLACKDSGILYIAGFILLGLASQVLSFFTICVWLIPFSLFISLSANENTLPTSVEATPASASFTDTDGDIVTNYFRRKSKRYGLLSFLKSAQETILPQRVKKGF